jgi:hypothetical protein
VIWSDRNLATEDLSESAEFRVEILMVPVRPFKALDEDGSALDVSASWLSSDGVHVVGEYSAHLTTFDPGIPVVKNSFLSIFDAIKHHESIIVMLEKWPKMIIRIKKEIDRSNLPFDANLARANIFLEIVAEVQVPSGLREVSNVDHLVCVVGGGAYSESLVHV